MRESRSGDSPGKVRGFKNQHQKDGVLDDFYHDLLRVRSSLIAALTRSAYAMTTSVTDQFKDNESVNHNELLAGAPTLFRKNGQSIRSLQLCEANEFFQSLEKTCMSLNSATRNMNLLCEKGAICRQVHMARNIIE